MRGWWVLQGTPPDQGAKLSDTVPVLVFPEQQLEQYCSAERFFLMHLRPVALRCPGLSWPVLSLPARRVNNLIEQGILAVLNVAYCCGCSR
jgi:hypothetical protein